MTDGKCANHALEQLFSCFLEFDLRIFQVPPGPASHFLTQTQGPEIPYLKGKKASCNHVTLRGGTLRAGGTSPDNH